MAEGILRESLDPRCLSAPTNVSSAGMAAPVGAAASPNSVTACAEIGVDIASHRATQLTPDLADRADLILAMELHHLYAARQLAPLASEKMHLLSQFAMGGGSPMGVDDPIGGSLDEYRESMQTIKHYVDLARPRIEEMILVRMEA